MVHVHICITLYTLYHFTAVDVLSHLRTLLFMQDLSTPWVEILTSMPVWALIIAEIGHDWGLYTMVTDLPKYMSDVMKFNPAQVI
jgi:hypothetical protein